MTSTNVIKFLELQTQINTQITQYGEADAQLAGELELVGDQLTGDEIAVLCSYYEGDDMSE